MAARDVERAAAAGRAIGISGVELGEAEESRAARPDHPKREAAKNIRGLLAPAANVIALDENGTQMTSRSLATELGRARDQGLASAAFVIGGPDGLEPAFLASASLTLSFGAMTWPHQLVRIMAAEQIYRAAAILSGHPYRRDQFANLPVSCRGGAIFLCWMA
ncbi:MAG: 23S rRNA (pseudouridine(1915)-N(3))-methyltransferase RlmH [Methylocella sp.]